MPKSDIPKAYEARQYEDQIYAAWEKSGFFNPDNLSGDPYAIMMPPPNVTGILHLGHALENTLMDTMARFQRMRGKKVLLVPGTDHAALPTQAKVEKMLMEQGIKNPRQELGREALVEKIRDFAEQSKATILSQIRKMGTSCDWSRLAYTFDEKRSRAVNELFIRLYNDGLIYRGYRVVNWSVKGQSTCSDDEVEYIERTAKLYTFKYAKDFPIAISSTRPETKLGDTAVAVHPTDERYQKFVGQTFIVDVGAAKPLEIKIIADEHVDPQFGTGALGVTPAHSPIDFALYEKQKAKQDPIGLIPVIGTDGTMTEQAGDYAGLSVEAAREKFVAWLRREGLLEKEEEVRQEVGTSDRYGDVLEALPMTQWWLDVNKEIPGRNKSLRDLMREAVTTGLDGDSTQRVTITPDRFTKLYLDRIENLRDWCLSRQVWWGHRIPVWYCTGGKDGICLQDCRHPIASVQKPVECPACHSDKFKQDPDTLDTWFSSGSWTFSTLGWPEPTKDLQTFHPTDWMQMGYEILYLWLMRMILMSSYALGEIPFKEAYIHGILRDKDGKKFSKSSGNGIDPIEVIEQYGCDALRISLLIGISPGNDSRYFVEKIESGRNFTNKLWNIARFVIQSTDSSVILSASEGSRNTLADRWIRSRFATVIQEITDHLEKYEFSQAGEKLRDFTWNEFADWYLEISKVEQKNGMLLQILRELLVLWHPFMPFVTEVIWKQVGEGLLMVQPWPIADASLRDEQAEQDFTLVQQAITSIRNIRAEYKVEPKQLVNIQIQTMDDRAASVLMENVENIKKLSRVDAILPSTATPHNPSAIAVFGSITIHVSLPVDVASEKTRLQKAREEKQHYIEMTQTKLENDEFTSKAPARVVKEMKEKFAQAKNELSGIEHQMSVLDNHRAS
ncbi:valine--tRNA ligase [Candidatus Uhrbacteria bacterium]|nr:valine--tRNA ligase [Candidatus Uhrbacteria bacterium]